MHTSYYLQTKSSASTEKLRDAPYYLELKVTRKWMELRLHIVEIRYYRMFAWWWPPINTWTVDTSLKLNKWRRQRSLPYNGQQRHCCRVQSWTWVESIHGSGRVGLGHKIFRLGWVVLRRVWCPKYLINILFTRKKPIIRRLKFIMIRSCNIAIYYSLIIYSNIKDVLFWQRQWIMKRWYWYLSWKSYLVDKTKDSAADGKTKSHA